MAIFNSINKYFFNVVVFFFFLKMFYNIIFINIENILIYYFSCVKSTLTFYIYYFQILFYFFKEIFKYFKN